MVDFESQKASETKIIRKLCLSRLQIGVEGVKGEKGPLPTASLSAFSFFF